MEMLAIEGDSPVYETEKSPKEFLSTTVKICGNLGEPSSKAKYNLGPIVN